MTIRHSTSSLQHTRWANVFSLGLFNRTDATSPDLNRFVHGSQKGHQELDPCRSERNNFLSLQWRCRRRRCRCVGTLVRTRRLRRRIIVQLRLLDKPVEFVWICQFHVSNNSTKDGLRNLPEEGEHNLVKNKNKSLHFCPNVFDCPDCHYLLFWLSDLSFLCLACLVCCDRHYAYLSCLVNFSRLTSTCKLGINIIIIVHFDFTGIPPIHRGCVSKIFECE